jgi:hypothetical protein
MDNIDLYHNLHIPRANLYKYKGEKLLHIEIVQRLLPLTLDEKLQALWFHPANEAIKSKEHGIGFNIMLKMMGKIPGVPDLVFMWKNGAGFIELKSAKGKLTESQEFFQRWCKNYDIPFEIAKSWEEVENILRKWNVLV